MSDRRHGTGSGDDYTSIAPPLSSSALLDILDSIHDAALLRRLASHHESLARLARSRAALLDQRAATWTAPVPKAATATPLDALALYLANGNTLDAAARSVAAQTGMQPDDLIRAHNARMAAQARQQRRERNATILAMAGRGMRDKEIADQLGLHRKHVNKIVRRAIRAQTHARSLPAQPHHVVAAVAAAKRSP